MIPKAKEKSFKFKLTATYNERKKEEREREKEEEKNCISAVCTGSISRIIHNERWRDENNTQQSSLEEDAQKVWLN